MQKTFKLSPEEVAMLRAEVVFGSDHGKHYAVIPRQLDPETYQTIDRILQAMHGKWNTKSRRHEFKVGYKPASMMASIDVDGTIRIEKDGFFSTSDAVVDFMIEKADVQPGLRYCEPSAGTGAICLGLVRAGIEPGQIDVLETNSERQKILVDAGYRLVGTDFLEYPLEHRYDRILMNPPFEGAADAKHIAKAMKHLAPNGKLVGLAFGTFGFRSQYGGLRALVQSAELLPPGSFKEAGTDIDVYMVTFTRPEGMSDADIDAVEPAPAYEKEIEETVEEREYEDPLTLLRKIQQETLEAFEIMNGLMEMLGGEPVKLGPPAVPAPAPTPALPVSRQRGKSRRPVQVPGIEQLTIFGSSD